MKKFAATNIRGKPLQVCGTSPMTGFFRDGCCNTGHDDAGMHTVCARVAAEFLEFSKSRGNDLTQSFPGTAFPSLRPGIDGACALPAGSRPMWWGSLHRSTWMQPTKRRWRSSSGRCWKNTPSENEVIAG